MRSINHRSALTLVAGPGRIPEGEGDFDCMVTVALDGILELTGAERGILRLHDACGELILETARARGRKNLAPSEHRALRPLIEVLRARGLPYQQGHVLAHPVSLGRPAPAAPWRLGPAARRESSHGLIYLERPPGESFPPQAPPLVEWFSQLVAVEAASELRERPWRWRCLDVSRLFRDGRCGSTPNHSRPRK